MNQAGPHPWVMDKDWEEDHSCTGPPVVVRGPSPTQTKVPGRGIPTKSNFKNQWGF